MKKIEIINKIVNFQEKVKKYRCLLSESRDRVVPKIVRNYKEIEMLQSELTKMHAGLEKYIKKVGKNPKINDGVWNVWYSPYDNAFTKDVLIRTGKSTDTVVGDLDYVIGKLENMEECEFKELFNASKNNFQGAINTSGGKGGRGGDGPGGGGGGDGGNGGKVVMMQVGKEFTKDGVETGDVKNLHKQYWKLIVKSFFSLSRKFLIGIVFKITIGVTIILIATYFIYKFGWN